MGADRDAPLPAGAALPTRSKRPHDGVGGGTGGGMILPSSKRSKSCYDRDIDPLYCAWGVDVYDLFVNTKSDLGPNPYKVDDAARKEYLSLPDEERDRLGFEARLFSKLQELVQHCDRTVARNNDKLHRELQRQSQKRGTQTQDYVVEVSDDAVEEVIRTEIQFQDMKEDLLEALVKLSDVRAKEEETVKELKEQGKNEKGDDSNDDTVIKEEGIKKEDNVTVMDEPDGDGGEDKQADSNDIETSKNGPSNEILQTLGSLTLEKQRLLCQIASIMSQLGPLEDSIEVHHKNLNHVKSDITSDKTVCEVSGNFMSARDADERIAGK
jgi:hypothetical protein